MAYYAIILVIFILISLYILITPAPPGPAARPGPGPGGAPRIGKKRIGKAPKLEKNWKSDKTRGCGDLDLGYIFDQKSVKAIKIPSKKT